MYYILKSQTKSVLTETMTRLMIGGGRGGGQRVEGRRWVVGAQGMDMPHVYWEVTMQSFR